MGEFFSADSAFSRFMGKLVDIVWLSLLWFVCCIPIFTIGASTCGLYYAMNKSFKHDRGYATGAFFHGFASNFKMATPIWLLSVLGYAFIGTDLYLTIHLMTGVSRTIFTVVFIVIIVAMICWNLYTFPYISRFENTRRQSMSNAGRLAIAELPWTFALLIIFVATILVYYLFMPALLFVPAIYMFVANSILEKIFRKYMSEEDIAAEEERNRDYYN